MECSHYTSLSGLLGIFESECIWATNIYFLNDEREYLDAIHHVSNIIPNHKFKETDPEWEYFGDYKNDLIESLEVLVNEWKERNYTVSFSKEFDQLSQWRGYCKSNQGYGVVFDIEQVIHKTKEKFKDVVYRDCHYNEAEKKRAIINVLNSRYTDYKNTLLDDGDNAPVVESILSELDELACFFKDEAFSEEKEVRIVIRNPEGSKIEFRNGDSHIIPYIKIPFPKAAVKKIIIGPTIDSDLSKRGMMEFLKKHYQDNIPDIVTSEIPFRSW